MELDFFNKPCSIRFNGYCKEFEDFIIDAYEKAVKCGCVITDGLQNPTAGNVEYFQDNLGVDFECSKDFFKMRVSKWLPQLKLQQSELLANSIFTVFEQLKASGKNDSALRNFYTKLMCWLYYKFTNVLTKIDTSLIPVVIYTGSYGTYELRTMQILNLCGCSVAYIDIKGDETSYKKYDSESKCTSLYEFKQVNPFPATWSLNNVKASVLQKQKLEKVLGDKSNILNIQVLDSVDFHSLPQTGIYRLQVIGVDETYQNTLFDYKQSLSNSEFITGNVPPIKPDEIGLKNTNFRSFDDCLVTLLSNIILNNIQNTTTFKYAFSELISKKGITNTQKCISLYFLCIRYKKLFDNGVMFILGDDFTENTIFVIEFLKHFNTSIVVLNPKKSSSVLAGIKIQDLKDSADINDYPTSKAVISTTTVASQAESEIHNALYNSDLGIYMENQYSSAKVTYLNCTYDEIKLLWNEELRMRTGFETVDSVVTMPVIYGKLNGIPDGDYSRFTQMLQTLKETSLVFENDIIKSKDTCFYAAECMSNGKVSIEKIREHKNYKYAYLRDDIQNYMLAKIQDLLDLEVIKGVGKNGIENTLFSVVLNLPQQFIQTIQNFDFTKRNPKLIIVRTSTEQMSLEDSILTNYLSLLGFDILLVVPTGYNVLDAHTTKELYKTYEFGNYKYDFKLSDLNQKSFFDKLFGRR